MSQVQTEPISSPCIGVCAMNEETGFCHGCYRTIDEIREWWNLSEKARLQVMQTLTEREQSSLDFGE